MKRRASSCLIYERPHKNPYLVLRLRPDETINRKRFRDYCDIEMGSLLKRLNPAPENRVEIDISISEISALKKRTCIYLHPCLWEYYSWGLDPRDWYATDIQRVFRGWSFRKKHRSMGLRNSFI
jgi:hypothetical protein